jgi:large subunit ribosomal protein L25
VVLSQHLLRPNDEPPTSSSRTLSRKNLVTTERKQIHSILKSVELPFFYSTTFALQIRAGSGSSHLVESGLVLPIKASQSSFLFSNNEKLHFIYLLFIF